MLQALRDSLPSIFPTPTSEALQAVNLHKKARARLLFSYFAVKTRLKWLQMSYTASKGKKFIERYKILRNIVADTVILDDDTVRAIDLPKRAKQESLNVYIERVQVYLLNDCSRDTMISYKETRAGKKSAAEIFAYHRSLQAATYRLIRRYTTLKTMLRTLRISYDSAKKYPIFPRNILLKVMIKRCVNMPELYEICQEVQEIP
uniref:Uncharacterized protein n=1 Tax=Plectus sambesii TaxID=2011161 RepID=A0A914VH23_9BILA